MPKRRKKLKRATKIDASDKLPSSYIRYSAKNLIMNMDSSVDTSAKKIRMATYMK